jgi:cysteine desulfurase
MSTAVYLDCNATAPIRPEAAAAVARALAIGGNPSSVHAAGRAARAVVEAARARVAELVGAAPSAVTFVGGGTEANALGLASALAAGRERIIIGAAEHDAIRETALASGLQTTVIGVDGAGLADLAALERALGAGPPALVCLMAANNETGVIQPIAAAAAMARAAGAWLHVDAVQAAGKIGVDMAALGADSLAVSAHKLGGPQGVGALVLGPGAAVARQIHGGGQERGARAGTENVGGIAGFGAAAAAATRDLSAMAGHEAWRDDLAIRLEAAGAVVLGAAAPRLPQTLCVAMPGWSSEIQVMAMDLAGVMISAGAACSSGKVRPSAVAIAMGRADLAPFAVRISGGWASTEADWRRCGDAWLDLLAARTARARRVA